MYNSKDLVVDEDLTFLSYNQTINAEFTLEEILESHLWSINSDNGLIKAIPLFNCDKITSSNESDKVLDSNKCVILENDMDTIVKCISDDTGSMHYHSVELYAYAPYTKLDVISEVTVYCILHDEYLNTVGNVNVDVYIDDELTTNVVSDSNGVCRFKVDQPCTVKFVYGELESNIVVIDEPHSYSLSVVSDKDIISYADGESATLTATLKDNGVVVSGETLSYEIKHGQTTIDTGTDTTDNNGQISIIYTGTGIGDVDVIVSYSSLLQETYELSDYYLYDPTTSDHTSNYGSSITLRNNGASSITYNSGEYYIIQPTTTNSESFIPINVLNGLNDFTIEFDGNLPQDASLVGFVIYKENTNWIRLGNTNASNTVAKSVNGSFNEQSDTSKTQPKNTWLHYKFTVTDNKLHKQIYNGSTLHYERIETIDSGWFTSNTKYGLDALWSTNWNFRVKNITVKAL